MNAAQNYDWASSSAGPPSSWPRELSSIADLVLRSPTPMALLVGTQGLVVFNESLRRVVGHGFDNCVGLPITDVFPKNSSIAQKILNRMQRGRPLSIRNIKIARSHDVVKGDTTFDADFTPVLDSSNTTIGSLAVILETTSKLQAVAAEKCATLALEEGERRFRAYTETLPHVVFGWDAQGTPVYANKRWYEFTGFADDDMDLSKWAAILHPDDREVIRADWQRCLTARTRHDSVARNLDRHGRYRWMRGMAAPIRDAAGEITSWVATLTDVHDARLLETEREAVARELDHRIGNLFAVAQGLVSLTETEEHCVDSFAERIRGRLRALHHSHSLIRKNKSTEDHHQKISLHSLIREILKPYEISRDPLRVQVTGTDMEIDGNLSTALSLTLHELGTNSAKYGALSGTSESLSISSKSEESTLAISWIEQTTNTPIFDENSYGFGSLLLKIIIEDQLSGSISRKSENNTIFIEINIPLNN